MSTIFCCFDCVPFEPTETEYEAIFDMFLSWDRSASTSVPAENIDVVGHIIEVFLTCMVDDEEFVRWFMISTEGAVMELAEEVVWEADLEKMSS